MKIISVNIERKNHLDRLFSLLKREEPCVVCLQEVMEDSVPYLSETFGFHATFIPLVRLHDWGESSDGGTMGIATLTTVPHQVLGVHFYEGDADVHSITRNTTHSELHDLFSRAVLVVECSCAETESTFAVGTTHFTYTPDGMPDQYQATALSKLLEVLAPYNDLVLVGDFNIPRPNELYQVLTQHFTDNIPSEIVSSLDPVLHRKKNLLRMVDYFWTRGKYHVGSVQVLSGVSDHCALVGEVN